MDKFDDDAAALRDIATSPDISGEPVKAGKKPRSEKTATPEAPPPPVPDERVARFWSVNLKHALKRLGVDMDESGKRDAEEAAGLVVEVIQLFSFPRPVFLGLVVAAFLAPWGPVVYRLIVGKPKEEGKDD